PIPPTPAPPPVRPNFADVVANVGDTGSIRVHTDSFLLGGDLNLRHQLLGGCGSVLDGLLGFRYMRLDESITITESGTPAAGGGPFTLSDRFRTVNNFYAGQIGLAVRTQ